jgi:4-diphosphocytidyl-2-C-methyl-D-erythritol kinase
MRVRAYAKLNLTLEVLNRRPDGFHDLRTVFQTVSLHDVLDIEARRARRTRVSVVSSVDIQGENLATRAAEAVLGELGAAAEVTIRLHKRIPMGAGMGGGSSDAAAVLRALPLLLNKRIEPTDRLFGAAARLGSDVPFFLLGGTALGLGRGTELYPLPGVRESHVLVVAPDVHVATADAYRALNRTPEYVPDTNVTEQFARALIAGDWPRYCVNDFEAAVFAGHPALAALRRRLARAGARVARMTGSGSALFGVFDSAAARDAAAQRFTGERVFAVSFVPRQRAGMLRSKLPAHKGA